MSSYPLLPINREASGAIEPYRIVSTTANDGVLQQSSAATDVHVGVSSNVRADDGERIGVEHAGIVPVQYGADGIAPGDQLTSDADGKAIVNDGTAGNVTLGTAMEGGDTDEIGAVLISPYVV